MRKLKGQGSKLKANGLKGLAAKSPSHGPNRLNGPNGLNGPTKGRFEWNLTLGM